MFRKRCSYIFMSLIGLLLLAACQGQTTEVTRVVEVPGAEVEVTRVVEEVVEEEVEVTRVVEMEGGVTEVNLVARCKASPPYENGRCDNLIAAVGAANRALAEEGDNRRIALETIQDDADWGDYKTEFELASDAGEAPDIIVSGHEHIGDWATAGYLVDLTDMIPNHPEFENVIPRLWASTELDGRRWGIPQDAEARPLYFSKPLLSELGWSDEEIENLDDQIYAGEFTLQDVLEVAQQAVDQGVVDAGDGYWHRPANGPDFLYFYYGAGGEVTDPDSDRLIFDREAALEVYNFFHQATQELGVTRPNKLDGDWDFHIEYTSSFENVLFVSEGTWRWASWHTNYLEDRGGEAYLFENVGFAPIPANENGIDDPITLTHPLLYMVSSQSEHPDLALLLIAKTTTKELNTPYAIDSGHLGVLTTQADYAPYVSADFLSQTLPLLEHTTYIPNSPYWSAWSEAYYLGIQAVETGDLTPEEAVDVVAEQMQNELGDNVVIR